MDLLSIIGITLGLVAILGGNLLEGGQIGSLLQLTAFVIVFGGTLGAVLLTQLACTRLARLVGSGLLREVGTGPQDPKRRYFRAE